jgi:hypothetical protein
MSELTENHWQIAHAMARFLVQEQMDKNELKKAMAYLRTCVEVPDGGERFFKYLQNLVHNGAKIGHSGKTPGYYRSLNDACVKYLQAIQHTPQNMLDILGWVGRLIPYYAGTPVGELLAAPMEVTVLSSRQAEIAQVAANREFLVAQEIEAKVTKVAGNKVSYEILGVIRLTEKEPKNKDLLTQVLAEDRVVTVKVVALKEDGSIKSVKYLR